MNKMSIILNGIIKENPTFVLLLGMCPTLGTTSSAENGDGTGDSICSDLFERRYIISKKLYSR